MKLLHDSALTLIEVEVDDNEHALLTAYRAIKEFQAKIEGQCENLAPLRTVNLPDTTTVLEKLTPPIDVMSDEEEIDSEGTIWVKGVHSASKKKDKKGKWVKARSVHTDERVLANKKVAMPDPINVPTPPPLAPPPPPPSTAFSAYDRLLELLRKRAINPDFSPSDITRIFEKHGVQNVLQLQSNPAPIDSIIAELEETL